MVNRIDLVLDYLIAGNFEEMKFHQGKWKKDKKRIAEIEESIKQLIRIKSMKA